MGSNVQGDPAPPWPRRGRDLVRGGPLNLAALALDLVVTVAEVAADGALGASRLLVSSLDLAIGAVVLLSLRGEDSLSVTFGCVTFVAVTSQATGVDLLVAAQQTECEGEDIVRGIQILGVE